MLKSNFVEDIFISFFNLDIPLLGIDSQATESFYNLVIVGKSLTQNQGNFLVKILKKYATEAKVRGLDYSTAIISPQWKSNFRVLDLSRKIHVEQDEHGELWICAKFPFSMKETFDKAIISSSNSNISSKWDADNRVRKLRLYDYNLIEVYDFAVSHNFEIDNTFLDVIADVEHIWEHQDEVIPSCYIEQNSVKLKNANDETVQWWEAHTTANVNSDLLLAKSIGYPYKGIPTTTVEKMAVTESNQFWLKSNSEFFKLYKSINGIIAVIVNKGDAAQEWIKRFVLDAELAEVEKSDIRVCFRLNKDENGTGFNQWVKDNNLGGPVEGAKIYIFQNKPPKWLFSQDVSVKIIATNSLYPIPSTTTQTWMANHTCVCFVGEIKASNIKDKHIVEL